MIQVFIKALSRFFCILILLSGAVFSMVAVDEDVLTNAQPQNPQTKIMQLLNVLREFAHNNGFSLSFDGRQKEEYLLFCAVEACTKAFLKHAELPAAQAAYCLKSTVTEVNERSEMYNSVIRSYYQSSQKAREDVLDKWLHEKMPSLWCSACFAAEEEKKLYQLSGDIHKIIHESVAPHLQGEDIQTIGDIVWVAAKRYTLNEILSNGAEIFGAVFKKIKSKADTLNFSQLPPLADLPRHRICAPQEGEIFQPWPFIYNSSAIFLFFMGKNDSCSLVSSLPEELVNYILLFVVFKNL